MVLGAASKQRIVNLIGEAGAKPSGITGKDQPLY